MPDFLTKVGEGGWVKSKGGVDRFSLKRLLKGIKIQKPSN